MPALKLEQFSGSMPAWDPALLPVGQASSSSNVFAVSGALIGWRQPKLLRTLLNGSATHVFRIPNSAQTQAGAYLIFFSLPTDGMTVTVGDLTYTFRNTVAAAFDVSIDGTKEGAARNLAQAISADNGLSTNAGTRYGNGTSPNSNVFWLLPNSTAPDNLSPVYDADFYIAAQGAIYHGVFVGALDFGVAFNLIKVASSAPGTMLWLANLNSTANTTTTYANGSNDSTTTSITGPSTWIESVDPDTDVIRSPVALDQWDRYYMASPSIHPQYNTAKRIRAGLSPYLLGVPPPPVAPTVSTPTVPSQAVTIGPTVQTVASGYPGGPYYGGSGSNQPNNITALVQVNVSTTTSIGAISWYFANEVSGAITGAATAQWAGVVYSDNNGIPNILLGTTQIVTGVSGSNPVATPNTASFASALSLSAGTYWVGVIIDSSAFAFIFGLASGYTGCYFSSPFAGGPQPIAQNVNVTTNLCPVISMQGTTSSAIVEARSYVYTWVTAYNEEGPPSPPTLVNGLASSTWTLGFTPPPANFLGVTRNITTFNVYRTVTATGGATVFFFVVSLPISQTSYVDNNLDSIVALNGQLATTNWFPPPDDLRGLIAMQNGMVAGFVHNEVWFCEPYFPHAWPPSYVQTLDYPIVDLALTNGALIACTNSHPAALNGTHPTNVTVLKGAQAQPCTSRGSVVGDDTAVSYVGTNGLIQINAAGQANNTTELWVTREKWQQLTPQKYCRSAMVASFYLGLGTISPDGTDTSLAQTGFAVEIGQDTGSFTIWPQPGGHRIGFLGMTTPLTGVNINNVITDPWTAVVMIVANGNVYYYDFSDANPIFQQFTWKSKVYQQNVKRSFGAMKVFFSVPPTTATQNANRIEAQPGDPAWNLPLPSDRYGYIKTYTDWDGSGDLVLFDCREIRKSGELMRFPGDRKAERWQWEVDGRVRISNIQIATSVKDLGAV